MKVLVADDDPVIALGFVRRLKKLGHEPIGPAHDGASAVELARQTLPDLYMFDITMPVMDGLTAEVDRATQALEDQKLLERAKGLLMDGLGLSEQEAFQRIRRTARDRNLTLAEVAARVIDQEPLLGRGSGD